MPSSRGNIEMTKEITPSAWARAYWTILYMAGVACFDFYIWQQLKGDSIHDWLRAGGDILGLAFIVFILVTQHYWRAWWYPQLVFMAGAMNIFGNALSYVLQRDFGSIFLVVVSSSIAISGPMKYFSQKFNESQKGVPSLDDSKKSPE